MNRALPNVCGLLAAIALVACAPGAPVGTPAAAGDRLIVGTGAGLRALDPATGRTAFDLPRAVPFADWSTLISARPSGDATQLAMVDGKTGAERLGAKLGADLEVRVVSGDGRRAALVARRPGGTGPYAPLGRERTTIVVADLDGRAEPRQLDLPGNLEPEAFSIDDQALFAIEWLPATAPDRYRVRRIDLATQTVQPVFTRDKVPNLEEMRGQGRQQVLAPDRQTLYTLYTKQPDHVHARDMLRAQAGQPTPMVHAFVHTLGLDWGWTFCLDLPLPLGVGPSGAHTIAVSPDGRSLYAADRSSGTVVRVDTRQLQIVQTATVEVDPLADQGGASSVVGRDGTLYLGGPSGVLALDGATLRPKARFALPGAVGGLGLSADGRRLYVGFDGRVRVFDAASGQELGGLPAPGLRSIRQVIARAP